MNKHKAFTLSEVLITIAIVGVIAAITLPVLINKYREMVIVNRLRDCYAVFSQAYLMAINDNGDITNWDIGNIATLDGSKKLYNYFKPYLKNVKECNDRKGGCFATSYKALFSEFPYIYQPNLASYYTGGMLANGISFTFWSGGNTNHYGAIKVDINGIKGPNRAGVDYFSFFIGKDRISPEYVTATNGYGEFCKYNNSSRYNGAMCTGWVINNGNLDYLRRDVTK